MPAKALNANAITSGRYSLCVGNLPEGCERIRRRLLGLRRDLEAAVLERHGEISISHAATIFAAVKSARQSELCDRWLAQSADPLTVDQRVALARDSATAAERLQKLVKSLSLVLTDEQKVGLIFAPAMEDDTHES